MNVREDAVVAARAEYPDVDVVMIQFEEGGDPQAIAFAGNQLHAMARTPYAHGYQAGHAASLAATIAFARKVKRRPEIDEPGCCETCRGSGRVAVGPWGSRPPKVTCEDCDGSGWSQ